MITPAEQAAAEKYHFRRRRTHESEAFWRAALILYIEHRDWGLAHELRVGKPQAEWTPDEHKDFIERLRRKNVPSETLSEPHRAPIIAEEFGEEPTDEGLLRLVTRGLEAVVEERTQRPRAEIPVYVSGLLTTGALITTVVATPDRVALVKLWAQMLPLYGYVVVTDAFMHSVNTEKQSTSKVDAIMARVGSRTLRQVRFKPYRWRPDGSVEWLENPPVLDEANITEDAWSGIFVSVPTPGGAPS